MFTVQVELAHRMEVGAIREKQKRMMNMLRVMKWRGHERYFISSGTRDLIGMMSLLEAPYHLIVSIAELKSKAVLRQRVHGSWNPDLVKRLSREAVEKRPAILVEAQDPQNPLTFKATRMLTESKLALWLTEQNAKGIAVPTSLLRLKYVEMWGMGPHAEKTEKHLAMFRRPTSSTPTWCLRFRRKWQFSYAKCVTGSWLPPDIAEHKVQS